MAGEQDGPTVVVEANCFNCKHCQSESYRCQGDSGTDVYCAHPDVVTPIVGSRRHVGDSHWKTPSWCPLLGPAVDKLIAATPRAAALPLDTLCLARHCIAETFQRLRLESIMDGDPDEPPTERYERHIAALDRVIAAATKEATDGG